MQTVKEPMFSTGENMGSCAFRYKNKQYLREKGVVPTPICQFFQIHGSIFKPDPSCDCGQASVVCITHCVFLFCIRKDPFYRFFALCINFFRSACFSYLLHQIQILLPNVCFEFLLPFFVCSALRFTRAVFAILWCASVSSLSISVRGCMS